MKVSRRQVLKGAAAIGAGVAAYPLLNEGSSVSAVPQATRPQRTAALAAQTGEAQYFVLDSSDDGDSVRVAMHFAVPAETNLAGLTLAQCLVQDASVSKTSVVPWVSSARQALLDSGQVYEHVIVFKTNGNLPASTRRARLDQRYRDLQPIVADALRRRYWAWGYERSGL